MAANVSPDGAAPPSTPVPQVFSDEATRPGTPPSSPPAFPWESKEGHESKDDAKENNPPSRPAVMNVFSILGKRKALDETTGNARTTKKHVASRKSSAKDAGLIQTQMNLGQSIQTTCKQCGMEYVLSSAEDRSLHAKFHKQNSEGVEVGTAFADGTEARKRFTGVTNPPADAVIMVDSSDKKTRQKKSQAVLEVVQRELGAVPIFEADIWEKPKNAASDAEPQYRSYLYVRDGKCIGYLLTQSISEAYTVELPSGCKAEPPDKKTLIPDSEGMSALARLKARKLAKEQAEESERKRLETAARRPICLSKTRVPVVLGISRIWTSPMHRGQGIAMALLDTAVERHNAHAEATRAPTPTISKIESKAQVAFSQPTESGAKLARKWTGRLFGWSVYVDWYPQINT
ncbi:hypothetical protein TI39_contig348g00016 [Zymoseptoria brevis]|uniref:Uncharacterized protein n=1 Tax=Zymoseptoria brevis TaxID=1047168 RepID=A0A0F4GUP6_9PEZI|nr:hypothetical protein TI39_contig348g00016 [Zymoseptoria brevis]